MDKTMNLVQAADYCKMDRWTFSDCVNANEVKHQHNGRKGTARRYRFTTDDLDEFMNLREQQWKIVEVAE